MSVLSSCAGDGRDLLEVLAGRDDAARVTATLLELDPRNVARAVATRDRAHLTGVTVTQADAGDSSAYLGAVPADLILLCGIFGNISEDDVRGLIEKAAQLCQEDAVVIWTRHRAEPDLTPLIRSWFSAAGFEEVAFDAPPDALFSVGVHRFRRATQPLEVGQRLFTFQR